MVWAYIYIYIYIYTLKRTDHKDRKIGNSEGKRHSLQLSANLCDINHCFQFLKFIFGIKLYMFRTVPLYTSGVFHNTHSNTYRFAENKLPANLYVLLCVLMMERGTVRNMYNFIPKINLRN